MRLLDMVARARLKPWENAKMEACIFSWIGLLVAGLGKMMLWH